MGEWIYSGAEKMLAEYSYTPPPEMDAALCFCYIDQDAGMSFHFLCLANYNTGAIDEKSYEKILEVKSVLMFRANPDFEIKLFNNGISRFSFRMDMVDKSYHADKRVLPTRDIKDVDHLRNSCYPDDIQVLLIKDGLETESPWVRLYEIDDRKLYGILLNEPFKDFGVHKNDRVNIKLGKHNDKVYAVVDVD
jgi:hypothetical protein